MKSSPHLPLHVETYQFFDLALVVAEPTFDQVRWEFLKIVSHKRKYGYNLKELNFLKIWNQAHFQRKERKIRQVQSLFR